MNNPKVASIVFTSERYPYLLFYDGECFFLGPLGTVLYDASQAYSEERQSIENGITD